MGFDPIRWIARVTIVLVTVFVLGAAYAAAVLAFRGWTTQ